MNAIENLRMKAVNERTLRAAGNYTSPRSYGVYRLSARGNVGKHYRFGNHPVRMNELIREHGACHLEALFLSRGDAQELARLLNLR